MSEDYIRAGFLCDLLAPWVDIEGSEWGHQLSCMLSLAEACLGTDDDRAVIVTGWMIDDLTRAFEEDWWGTYDEYEADIARARAQYDQAVDYWEKRAQSLNLPPSNGVPNGIDATGAYGETLASLPRWIKPESPEALKEIKLKELTDKRKRLEQELSKIDDEINQVL